MLKTKGNIEIIKLQQYITKLVCWSGYCKTHFKKMLKKKINGDCQNGIFYESFEPNILMREPSL